MVALPNIIIIGITGMSGAGKSTVCRVLSTRCDAVIDCDVVAREIAGRREFLDELRERFEEDVINPDGSLNRAETARIIFSDKGKRELYNRIIFQYIVYEVMMRIRSVAGTVLLDAPTLFEAGLDMICSKIVSVTADRDRCAERISERDGISLESARARLMSQHNAEFFKENSDFTIENNGSYEELNKRAEALIDRLNKEK